MATEPHVLVLGHSVFMDSLAESLLAEKKSVMTRVNVGVQDVYKYLPSLQPDLIIYELGHADQPDMFELTYAQPGISYLAVDLRQNSVFLHFCLSEPTGSIKDLCDLINSQTAFLHERKNNLVNIVA